MKQHNYYTGIGSRETPEDVTDFMSDLAVILYHQGYYLRSGRAEGADYAFQRGAEFNFLRQKMISNNTRTQQEIYLPNERFNKCFGNLGAINTWELDNYADAMDIMESVHPKGRFLRGFAREAHTRNVYQVLGRDLNTPSDFVVYWAKPKNHHEVHGGTNTAVQVARIHNIPCYNLYIPEQKEQICQLINLK